MKRWMKLIPLILIPLFAIAQLRSSTQPDATIEFTSEAPNETITARSKLMSGVVDWETGSFAFSVDIKSFAGFNNPMQRQHFNENYMESRKFPTATFRGKIIEQVNPQPGKTYTVRAKGKMNIHGVEKETIVPVTLSVNNKGIHVTSTFTVLLNDYNIRIPRIVSKKLSPEIQVKVNALLSKP